MLMISQFTGPLAMLHKSSSDPQRIGGSNTGRMCPGQAGTLEYTTETYHIICCHLCGA